MREPWGDSEASTARVARRGQGRVRLPAATLLLGLGALAAGCGRPSAAVPEPPCDALRLAAAPADANLIVVVNDTMRRDRMSAYGGPARTPAFDALARDGLLFTQAVTQSPWTKPAIATLFTGLYPTQHGVTEDPQLRDPRTGRGGALREADVLSPELETLAEVLQARGFRTGAFTTNPWMETRFGFAQGFEVYDDSFAGWGADGVVVTRAALAWLAARQPGERFFLYLHYLDSHLPYGRLTRDDLARHASELAADGRPLPEKAKQVMSVVLRLDDGQPVTSAGVAPSVRLLELAYDRGIEEFDRALAALLDGFRSHWAYERTAILVTSDHGEALFTRGYGNHGTGLFDDEAAIPLVARLPGVSPARGRVECLVGLIDVLPAACAYLGVACPAGMAGASFLGDTNGAAPRWLVTEGVVLRPTHRAIRNRSWKLLWETGAGGDGKTRENPYALFDVARDPGETRDLLVGARTPAVEQAFRTMAAALPEAVPPFTRPARTTAPVDERTRERLEALGYTH
jgi:arylsulfatase A-like enzyme